MASTGGASRWRAQPYSGGGPLRQSHASTWTYWSWPASSAPRLQLRRVIRLSFLDSVDVSDKGPLGTHQGVKGLEFERALLILDDSDARGSLNSFA